MCERVSKRLFVGGLARDVTPAEIMDRFSRFGTVTNLSLKTRTDQLGRHFKTFAHLDLEAEESNIKKCFSTYQNTKWKGSVLQIQNAKESFLQKLEKEREEERNKQEDIPEVKPSQTPQPQLFEVKGPAVPGTPVPGKKDWVVGKYGRVLPILKLKKSYKIKMMKYDPSKHCHAAKVFKDDKTNLPADTSCHKLTWEINTPDTEMTKKRKGLFPPTSPSTKKTKKLHLLPSDFFRNNQHLTSQTSRQTEEVQIVRAGSGSICVTSNLNRSNRFDSDLENDSEDDSVRNSVSTGAQTGNVNLSRQSSMGNNSCNQNNTKIKLNSHGNNRNKVVVTLANKEVGLTTPATASHNSNVKQDTQASASDAANNGTLPRGKQSHTRGTSASDCKKIPEFKGLGMLGLVQENSGKCGEQSGLMLGGTHLVNTLGLGVGDSCSPPSMSHKPSSVRDGLGVVSSSGRGGKLATTVTTSPNNAKQKSSRLKEKETQLPQKSSTTVKKVSSSDLSDGPPGIQRKDDRILAHDETLSSSSADTDEIIARCKRKHHLATVMEPAAATSSRASGILHSTGKCRPSPKEKNQPLSSSVLPNDTRDRLTDGSALTNYDSSSSADTDEIIARCKRKKGLLSHTIPVTETSSENCHMSNSVIRHQLHTQTPVSFSKMPRPSLLDDTSLSLSKFVAGILDHPGEPVTAAGLSTHEDSVYDSDLDSNDFELVVKKLTQKNMSSDVKDLGSSRQLVVGNNDSAWSGTITDSSKPQHGSSQEMSAIIATVGAIVGPSAKSERPKQTILLREGWSVAGSDPGQDILSHNTFGGSDDDADSDDDTDSDSDDGDSDDADSDEGEDIDSDDGGDGDEADYKEREKPVRDFDSKERGKSASLRLLPNAMGQASVARSSQTFNRKPVSVIDMNALRFDPTKIQKTPVTSVRKKTPPWRGATFMPGWAPGYSETPARTKSP